MEIKLQHIKIRELINGYSNSDEEGVFGYNGELNIRPKYQREYVYKGKERDMVIDTVTKSFPLNVMYWSHNEDGTYEVMDGQQRSISICEYVEGNFSIDNKYFFNLTDKEKEQILNYELSVYICTGKEQEKLQWFKTINIAGIKLTDQELRNAVYTGSWLINAKSKFSKTNCPASVIGDNYVSGSPLRQELLEKAIEWIIVGTKMDISGYMALHQHDEDATNLWMHFNNVINWVKALFPNYRNQMKSVNWGELYYAYNKKKLNLNAKSLEEKVKKLMMDDDVSKKSGIYKYLILGDERFLSIRAFTPQMRTAAFEKQNGVCKICKKSFDITEMEADHIDPWSQGGKTKAENCQMLCRPCNRRKSSK